MTKTNKYDFSFLSPCPIPGLIIQGDKDSVVSEDSVSELANRLSKQKNIDVNYRVIAGADHFFRDKIELLNEEIRDYLKLAFLHQIGKTTVKTDLTDKLSSSSPKKVFLD